ncbi:MAG TPA: hypothetical protein PKL70_17990 [Saprospiraceae bacterium]|nr:hypothetical protein [Saprospiraceae bacterium]
MKNPVLFFILALFGLCTLTCSNPTGKESAKKDKIPVYAWLGGPGTSTDEEIREKFEFYKEQGIDVLMYNGGQDPEVYRRVGKIARLAGLGFHTWIPTMVQAKTPEIAEEWYAINGLGESALVKPAYVDYYKFLCPSKEGVYRFLENMYSRVARVEEVDAIHLDYIRFPDVILARGLWDKYKLVMDREYPQYDYCYCEDCTEAFKQQTGIDIKKADDPSQVEEWKSFRYDLITRLVNRLADTIHATGKQINAAVFPGPGSVAKKLVRQEWDKWKLDAFFPMNYNDFYLEGTDWIGAVTKEAVTAIEGKKPVISGLFICPDPAKKASEQDPENHGLVPEELGEAIRQSMMNGATGICLFTPERMTEKHWVVFREAIYRKANME